MNDAFHHCLFAFLCVRTLRSGSSGILPRQSTGPVSPILSDGPNLCTGTFCFVSLSLMYAQYLLLIAVLRRI